MTTKGDIPMERILIPAAADDRLNKAIDKLVLGTGLMLFALALLGSFGVVSPDVADATAALALDQTLTAGV